MFLDRNAATAAPMMKRPAASEGDSVGEVATELAIAAAPVATAKKPAKKKRVLKPPTGEAAIPSEYVYPAGAQAGIPPSMPETDSADKLPNKTFAGVIEPKGRVAKAAWKACKKTWEMMMAHNTPGDRGHVPEFHAFVAQYAGKTPAAQRTWFLATQEEVHRLLRMDPKMTDEVLKNLASDAGYETECW